MGANISATRNGKKIIAIDSDKCNHCGKCIALCIHNAREFVDDTDEFFQDLQKEEKALAELDERMHSNEAIIKSQEEELSKEKNSLEDEVSSYKAKLDELARREDEITPGIDQEIVYKFQRIIKRNSEGIVAVRNGVCTGCHMILPAQFANEVHDGDKILFCPYCSRILFHQDVESDEVETYFTDEDTGSLSDFEFDDEDEEDQLDGEDTEDEDSDEEKPLSYEE
jgi:Fe-S-cluster-containing dehydrogenase component